MHQFRKAIKSCIAYSLYYSGILYLLINIKLRRRAVVLTYHRIISPDRASRCHSSEGIIVGERVFREQLPVIKRFFRPLDLNQFQGYLESGESLPDRSCLITFDDGWIDNYETAFPLLKEQEVPAVIFLPYNYISGSSVFWQEELMLRLSHMAESGNKHYQEFFDVQLGGGIVPSRTALREYVSELKHLDYEEIGKFVDRVRELTKEISLDDHYDRYMTWEQALEMQASIITFGSHSMSHRILTRLPRDECEQELVESRQKLESGLKKPVLTLAYPNGDHSGDVEDLAESAGYKLAFTTDCGFVSNSTPHMSLPRINIHDGSTFNKAVFLCTILNIF